MQLAGAGVERVSNEAGAGATAKTQTGWLQLYIGTAIVVVAILSFFLVYR